MKIIDYVIGHEDLVLVDGFPELKIRVFDHESKELIRTYWLSPFRRYCFQISGNSKGEDDIYSIPVIGLDNVIEAVNSMSSRYMYSNLSWGDGTSVIDVLFSGLIHKCINGCMGRVENLIWRIVRKTHEEEDTINPLPHLVIIDGLSIYNPIDEFATICTLYLMKDTDQGKSWARNIYNNLFRRSDRFYKIIEEMFGLENLADASNVIISKAN